MITNTTSLDQHLYAAFLEFVATQVRLAPVSVRERLAGSSTARRVYLAMQVNAFTKAIPQV